MINTINNIVLLALEAIDDAPENLTLSAWSLQSKKEQKEILNSTVNSNSIGNIK